MTHHSWSVSDRTGMCRMYICQAIIRQHLQQSILLRRLSTARVYVESDCLLQWDLYPPVHTKLFSQIILHRFPSLIYNILTLLPINIVVLIRIAIINTHNVHAIIIVLMHNT